MGVPIAHIGTGTVVAARGGFWRQFFADGTRAEVSHNVCRVLQRGTGWQYRALTLKKEGRRLLLHPEGWIPRRRLVWNTRL